MALNAYIGDTTVLTATFRSFSSETHQLVIEDPVSVSFAIYDFPLAATPVEHVALLVPTKVSDGIYTYSWTPTTEGTFLARFEGTFADTSVDVVDQDFVVYDTGTVVTPPGQLLGSNREINFSAGFTPLYVDPEELSGIFPDAETVEIAEYLHQYSFEVKSIASLSDTDEPTFLMQEYIKAAAACALSKIYDTDADAGLSVRLGDFAITNRAYQKTTANRGNATTWCEYSAALRAELMFKLTSPKATRKADIYTNPIPSRSLDNNNE